GGGGLGLHVLDSTDPGAIKAVEDALDLERTLFLISSKSGGTIETLSQYRYFRSKVDNGRNFVAITDPGSSLAELGEKAGFRRVGRAADRRVARHARQGDPARGRRAARRAGGLWRRSRLRASEVGAGHARPDRADRRRPAGRQRDRRRAGGPRPDLLLRRVRH